jgi:hypothetical protein
MINWQEANVIYKDGPFRVRKANWSFNGNQLFTFSKDWSGELSGFFQSADLGGVFVQKPMGSLDIGIKKKLNKTNSSFQLAVTNILKTMKLNFEADVPNQNIYSLLNLDFFSTAVRLTYTRSFGKEKLKERRLRATGSEEERQRVK